LLLDEEKALVNVKKCLVFNIYYDRVCRTINNLYFLYKEDLNGLNAMADEPYPGLRIIILRTSVCPINHARLVAHEFGHHVLAGQGFPFCHGSDSAIVKAFNSAFHDPLVEKMLAEYGFDLYPDRSKKAQNGKACIESNETPIDILGKTKWIFNCLSHLLVRHVLGELPEDEELLQLFRKRHPVIAVEAEKIACEVIKIGFDTPDKMFKCLNIARKMSGAETTIYPPTYPHS
jgi:hypothetical protein